MASRPRRSDDARIIAALERAVSRDLPPLLPRQRWFGDKGRAISTVALRDCAALGSRGWLVLVDVTFATGPEQTYAVPLALGREGLAPGSLSMTLETGGAPTLVVDAFDDPEFCRELLGAFEHGVIAPRPRSSRKTSSDSASTRSGGRVFKCPVTQLQPSPWFATYPWSTPSVVTGPVAGAYSIDPASGGTWGNRAREVRNAPTSQSIAIPGLSFRIALRTSAAP